MWLVWPMAHSGCSVNVLLTAQRPGDSACFPLLFRGTTHSVFLEIQLPSRVAAKRPVPQLPTSLRPPNKYTGPFHWRVLLLITWETDAGWDGNNKSHTWGSVKVPGSRLPEGFPLFLKQHLRLLLQAKEAPSIGKAPPAAQLGHSRWELGGHRNVP